MTPLEFEINRIIKNFKVPPRFFIMHPKDARRLVKKDQAKRMIKRMFKAMWNRPYYSSPLWIHLVDSNGNVTDNRPLLKHTGGKIEMVFDFNY